MKFSAKFFSVKLVALLIPIVFFFSACVTGGEEKHFTAFKNTFVTVQSRNKSVSYQAETDIREFLIGLNAEFSATEKNSAVYTLNSAKAGKQSEISARFKEIAEVCAEMRDFTNGKFDPSVYPLSLLWKFAPDYPVPDFSVPTAEEISATINSVGFDKFSFDKVAVKSDDNAKIDFGGALKGYAADKIAEILKADGVTEGFVNVGGSSLYLISVDKLSITHPRKNGILIDVNVKEKDLSVSTSGDYEKTYTAGGKTYSHIIDPFTGFPSESGVTSATVIGKNGLKLDALTTALCLFRHDFNHPEKGDLYKFIMKILESEDFKNSQIFVACVNGDNKQLITNKTQGDDFALLDKNYQVICIKN